MTQERNDVNASEAKGRWSRRDFVSTAGAAAVVAPLMMPRVLHAALPGVHLGLPRRDTLRVGLVGCGGRGTGAATQALNADPNVQLVGLADVFEERVQSCRDYLTKRAGESIGSRTHVEPEHCYVGLDSYKQLIDSGIDVVLLCTPPAFRPAQLRYAIERNKHVFCEKPMAVDAPGVRSVIESARLARERGLALVSGFCWRYSLPQRATYEQVHNGAIGEIRAMYTTYNAGGWVAPRKREEGWSDVEAQLRSWHYFTWISGDHIVEQACHAIDWMNWAMKGVMPKSCHAVGGRQVREELPETGHVYDHFGVTYEFENGARGYHMCRHYPGCPGDNSAYVLGSKGILTCNPWAPEQIRIEGETNWRYRGPRNDMYQTEHDELFKSIRDGEPLNDGEWMCNSTMLSIMGRMAAYTGQNITWDMAMNSQESLVPDPIVYGDKPVAPVAKPGVTKFF